MEAFVEDCVGVLEFFELLVGQRQLKNSVSAAAVDNARVADKYLVAQTILSAEPYGRGEYRIFVVENRADNSANRHTDAVVGRALRLDDLISRGADVVADAVEVVHLVSVGIFFEHIEHRINRHHRLAPRHELAVAVLTDNICVHMARINLEILSEQVTQSCGVERCACTDNLGGVKARKLVGYSCHYVNGVGGYEENSVKAARYHARND